MKNSPELYNATISSVLKALQDGRLGGEDWRNASPPLTFDSSDNLSRALIETGHEPLVQLILLKDKDYRIITEVIDGYFRAGRLDLVVATFKMYPDRQVNISHYEIIEEMIRVNVDDSLMLGYADYLYSYKIVDDNKYRSGLFTRVMVKQLWDVGRDDLAQEILEKYVPENEIPLMILLRKILRKEEVDPAQIAGIFETYCPLKPRSGWSSYALSTRLSQVISFMFSILIEEGVPPYLGKEIYKAYSVRCESDQMDSLMDGNQWKLQSIIVANLLELGDFEGVKEFATETKSAQYIVAAEQAKLDKAIMSGDRDLHKTTRDFIVNGYRENLARLIMVWENVQSEEDLITKADWNVRIEYQALRAKIECELAIFELKHGSPDVARAHIEQMITLTNNIGVPPIKAEKCPDKHMKTLRNHSRAVKRTLRERFNKFGLLKMLPKQDGWSDKMTVKDEQSEIDQRNSQDERNRQYEIKEAEKLKQAEKYKNTRDEQVRNALKVSVDKAIEVLQFQNQYLANSDDWDRGIEILRADPSKFNELLKILSSNYFQLTHFATWEREAHDGLVRFYIAGQQLGVIDEGEWSKLFDKWNRARFIRDSEPRFLPRDGVVTLVTELLSHGEWEQALSRYRQAAEISMDRRTIMECLAALIRYAAKNIPDVNASGVAAAFKYGYLPDNSLPQQQLEYWNCQVERAIAATQADDYRLAHTELLKLLEEPSAVSSWIRIMALGSIRDHHQKKDVLLGAHTLQRTCQEVRFQIVEAMIDHDIPGAEAMPEVKSKDTPFEVEVLLLKKLIEKKILHRHTMSYLTEKDLPYLRRILSQYQNQFNTVMETIEEDCDKDGRIPVDNWAGIITVLDRLGVITPGIYAEAKRADFDPAVLDKIHERIKELKKGLFANKKLNSDMSPKLIAETIWIAYQPVNMRLSEVLTLSLRVKDCTEHMYSYKFPEEGYELDLAANRTMILRKGAKLQTPRKIFKVIVPTETLEEVPDALVDKKVYADKYFVRKLCEVARFKMQDIKLGDVLTIMMDDPFFKTSISEFERAITDGERYTALRQNQEAFGVYLDDNLRSYILKLLKSSYINTSKMVEGLIQSLRKPGRRKTIEQQLGVELAESKPDIEIAAEVMAKAFLTKYKPLQDLRRTMNADTKQFTTEEGTEVESANVSLRAVISKNLPSFFAKASAGICTANDVSLFERSDHFHINLIDDTTERCVGNIQAYIMPHEGKNYLLLRGINPSTKLLKEVDVKSLTEAIISIGTQFASDNGLAGVMLSEQGGFLALSNRPEVTRYVQNKYARKVVDISKFKITDLRSIDSAYLVAHTNEGTELATRSSSIDPNDVFGENTSRAA